MYCKINAFFPWLFVLVDRTHQGLSLFEISVEDLDDIDDKQLYWLRRMVHDEETNKNWIVLLQKVVSLVIGSILVVLLTLLLLLYVESHINARRDKRETMRGSQLSKIMVDDISDTSLTELNGGNEAYDEFPDNYYD
jgi:hypothetical protein